MNSQICDYAGPTPFQYSYNSPLNYDDPNGLWGAQVGGFNVGSGNPSFALDGGLDLSGYWGNVGDTLAGEGKGAAAELSLGIYTPCYTSALQRQGGYVGRGLAMAGETLGGGLGGLKAAGGAVSLKAAKDVLEDSREFSHSIPASWLPGGRGGTLDKFLTDTKLNGNYVSPKFHYLTDPDRYPINKDLARDLWGEKWPAPFRQIGRVPLFPAGIAAGAGLATAGAVASQAPNGSCH